VYALGGLPEKIDIGKIDIGTSVGSDFADLKASHTQRKASYTQGSAGDKGHASATVAAATVATVTTVASVLRAHRWRAVMWASAVFSIEP
jgi:hypothetical protein